MVIKWKKRARRQLRDILYYHRLKASLKVARNIRTEIMETVDKLSVFPQMGCVSSDIDDNSRIYRTLVANRNYKVIYYIEGNIVYIFAIWDVRQDPQKLETR